MRKIAPSTTAIFEKRRTSEVLLKQAANRSVTYAISIARRMGDRLMIDASMIADRR